MRLRTYLGKAVRRDENSAGQIGAQFFIMRAANDEPRMKETATMTTEDDFVDDPKKGGRQDGYPPLTIVVFNTKRIGGDREYHVALVHRKDFANGLRCPDKDGLHLNPKVARPCFEDQWREGESEVYYNVEDAIAFAQQKFSRIDSGIKVLWFDDVWPGVACRTVA